MNFVLQAYFSKKVYESLPNEKDPCNWIDYPTCIIDTISSKIKNLHNCVIPPLIKVYEKLNYCSNRITLTAIKEMKKALKQVEYEGCKDIKPCKDVKFKANKREVWNYTTSYTKFLFWYDGFIVEYLEDSYIHSFLTIFSEIGGALGILIGLSCMTVVDSLIGVYKRIWKV